LSAITSAGRATGFEPVEPTDDARAAAALYERHSGRVFGYCLSRLRRREDAEDAVQTTFLHAVRGLRRGVVPSTEVAWLLGIARNVCLSRWESAGRLSRLESPCDPHELDRRSDATESGRDELIGLEDALQQLPDQQRQAVLLRDWRGLSYEEVAVQLGVSQAAVETLIFRGRRTLAELLREEPRTTRRRLHSLGSLGSFFSAIKTAFTGGAVATKVAMAVIAAVALSGAGAVAATSIHSDGPAPVHAPAATPPSVVSPVAPEVKAAAAESSASRSPAAKREPRTRSATPSAVAPAVASVTTAAPPASTPVTEAPAQEAPNPTPSSSQPHSTPHSTPQASVLPAAPVVTVPPTEQLVPAVTGVVQNTVDKLLPNLPVEVPSVELPPVVLPPTPIDVQVPAVPAVAQELPVTVMLPPVTVPKLLP
jgi:RNA polymerase sigma-70 factor, ECF subfamily